MDITSVFQPLIGIGGVFLGAAISYLVQRHVRRRDLTLKMHGEFFGDAMVVTRDKANRRLVHIMGLSLKTLDVVDDPEDLPIWQLLRFFQRLSVMVTYNEVDKRMVPELFGGSFVWWHTVLYDKQLRGTGWVMEKHIHELYEWIKKDQTERNIECQKRWNEWKRESELAYKRLSAQNKKLINGR